MTHLLIVHFPETDHTYLLRQADDGTVTGKVGPLDAPVVQESIAKIDTIASLERYWDWHDASDVNVAQGKVLAHNNT